MKFKNKKAGSGEQWLSPYMFVIWIIIILFLLLGYSRFYSAWGDIRQIEAGVLAEKVLFCLGDKLSYEDIASGNFNVFSFCDLNKEALQGKDKYFLGISIENLDEVNTKKEVYSVGVSSWKNYCGLDEDTKLPQCSSKSLYIFDEKTNKKYLLEVTAISNQV